MSKKNVRNEQAQDAESVAGEQVSGGSQGAQEHGEDTRSEGDLGLEDLDLSVETVEERISPSETNVFDK